jgi:signal transduction histidine kinase
MNLSKSGPDGAILIVDDTPTNLDILFQYLKQAGYKVLIARDGPSAVRRAEQTQPDIILLDVMMPGMDGFETCRHLKAHPATQEIPVIFMTALADVESKVKGFEVGGVDYLPKPFDHREVLARVQTHLALRAANRELELRLQELQARNDELDAFAHTVAHDLRGPLTSVIGLAMMLEKEYAPTAELRKWLAVIARSGRKMDNIIEELLLLAGVRQAQEVIIEPLDMGHVVAVSLERLAEMIDKYEAEVILPASWPPALGYGPWLEEVWVNYLSNGLKYGGHPPRLELGATPDKAGTIRFWIQDNGPGLTLAEQERLFMPFERLAQVSAKGHGLGLSIVRRIVEKLGGEVGVASVPGQGSRFSFTLAGVS